MTSGSTMRSERRVSRRRWLASLGSGGLGLIGGCLDALVGDQAPTETDRRAELTFSGESRMYGVEPTRIGANDGGLSPSPALYWSFSTIDGIWSTPAVVETSLYVGAADDHLYALDATTGDVNWRYDAGDTVRSSPAVADGLIIAGSMGGDVFALSRDGQLRWRKTIPNGVFGSPAIADETVYIGGLDGTVYALGVESGELKWRFETARPVFCSPAVDDDVVYVASYDRNFYAVNRADGDLLWERPLSHYVFTAPTVSDGTVFVARDDVIAFDASTGERQWSQPRIDRGCSPAVRDDSLIVVKDGVESLSVTDGSRNWQFEPDSAVEVSPTIAGGSVYVGDSDGVVYEIDLQTGEERWRTAIGQEIRTDVTVVDGAAFVGAGYEGTVYAFGSS